MRLTKDQLLAKADLKFDAEQDGVFSGYASTFGNNDADNDTILPGAFKASLKNGLGAIKGFFNHQQRDVPVFDLLNAKEDETGLWIEGKIDFLHHMGQSIYSAMKREALDAFSIGFTLEKDDYDMKDGFEESYWGGNRNIKSMTLREVSVVSFPADDFARVEAVKADLDRLKSLPDYERYLREAGGFSKSVATSLVSQLVELARGDHVKISQEVSGAQSVLLADALGSLKSSIGEM